MRYANTSWSSRAVGFVVMILAPALAALVAFGAMAAFSVILPALFLVGVFHVTVETMERRRKMTEQQRDRRRSDAARSEPRDWGPAPPPTPPTPPWSGVASPAGR